MAAGALAGAIALTGIGPLAAQDWRQQLPGFDGFRKDSRLSELKQREQRKQIREELSNRYSAELVSSVPLVSPYMVAAVQRAIERYQAIVARGGWPMLPEGTLREGDSGERVTLLRQHLAVTGDLRTQGGRPWQFDGQLSEALARYQVRHGLRVTGFVDTQTLRALNVPASARLHQLRINLARIQDLAQIEPAERYVMVNVPAYELQAVEGESLILRSAVVVGKPQRETPVVDARIIELNFYPYWRVPDSIATRDLIPQLRKDPSYFDREHFSVLKTWGTDPLDPTAIDWNAPEVLDYKFRQDPGPWNALGVVRINMPNVHTVYLHDTPLKHLFNQRSRAFSSGCVRVERVLDVAAWLLKNEKDWSAERVHQTVAEGIPLDVKLKKRVLVRFVYVTAWATDQGEAVFRPDIYRRDGTAELVAEDEDAPQDRSITP